MRLRLFYYRCSFGAAVVTHGTYVVDADAAGGAFVFCGDRERHGMK